MLIFVRGLSGNVCPIHVNPYENVLSVKLRIFYLKSIPIHDQHLLYSGIELLDQTVLSTANIGHGALLRLIVKLRTGPLVITHHSCKASTPTMNQNGHNNNNDNNNNNGSIPYIPNSDHTEESQWLSALLSPLSQVATLSTSASTIFLPSIYLPPGVVDVNKSEPTSNHTLTEYYKNSDNDVDDVNYEGYDDEISQIAEYLGYAIDETEQYHSLIDYPVVLNENQMMNSIQNESGDDQNDLDYCHLNQLQHQQQQFKCTVASSGDFPQYLTILSADFHNSSENIHPTNTSKCFHGFNAIEVPSERCQSASSLLTSTTTTAIDTAAALNLSSSPCQLKCNNSHSSLSKTCSSSFYVDCIHPAVSSSSVTTVDNDNLLKDHCSNSNSPIADTNSVVETSCVTAVISGLNKLQSHSSTIPTGNYPFRFDDIMKAESGVNGWVSSPYLTTNNDSSVVKGSFNPSPVNSKHNDSKNAEQLFNPIILDSAVTKMTNTICEQSDNQTHHTSIPKYHHHPSYSSSQESIANECVLKDDGSSHLIDRQTGLNSNSNNLQGLSPSSSSSNLTSSPSQSSSSCTTLTHSNRSRCHECNRRTRLACGFSCRCERWFCARHHHPEDHQCNFNFKTMVNSA
ncbi:unnamed protein product [Trichobilharzia szidati]|nr:unnamed protein product [Trichobilharzia szidati]